MEPISRKALQCPNCGANIAENCVSCDYCHAVLTITACPSCYSAVFKGMKFCPRCGAAVERIEVNRDQKRSCPRCEKILTTADIAGTIIHECSGCGGLWLDDASFQKLCEDKEKQVKVIVYPTPAEKFETKPVLKSKRFYIPCPDCGELMNQKNFAGCSGVVVDLCKPHGIWFDRQELQKIVSFIQEGGLHKAREKELENLKSEQNRLRDMQYGQSMKSINDSSSYLDLTEDGSLHDVIQFMRKLRQNW